MKTRVEVVRRREQFERDPHAFLAAWAPTQARVRDQILQAKATIGAVEMSDRSLERAAELCIEVGTDGLRGELTLARAARALAALERDGEVNDAHLRRVAPLVLGHRLRRNPLDEAAAGVRVERALAELFGHSGERHVV